MELSKEQLNAIRERRVAILEEIFALTYTTSMTFADCWNMPTSKRKWFVQRLYDQKRSESQAIEEAGKVTSPTHHIPSSVRKP